MAKFAQTELKNVPTRQHRHRNRFRNKNRHANIVISANTSVADMSGALGIPCMRFGTVNTGILLGQDNPPWYPSTRYYRIPPGEPAVSVVPRMVNDFKAWLQAFERQS